jgi:hypothetical protein
LGRGEDRDVSQEALWRYFGWDILDELLARDSDLSQDDAIRIAIDEVRQVRAERAGPRGESPAG